MLMLMTELVLSRLGNVTQPLATIIFYDFFSKILLGTKVIKTQRVYDAMLAVDRGSYTQSEHAYVDSPQGIGYGVTISAPHMVNEK